MSNQSINPAPHFLFCKPIEQASYTESGLSLGNKSDRPIPSQAVVIKAGSLVKEYLPDQTILYRSYAAVEIELGKTKYIMLEDVDVIGEVVTIEE
jgi:co-chaperonin GroES (HSP10)